MGRKRVYTVSSINDIDGTGAIVFDTTGTFLIDFVNNNAVSSLNFYGVDRSCDGIGPNSGGSLFFRDVSMLNFRNGFGKESGSYTGNSRLWNCHATANTTGIRNFVDGHFYGCEVNANEGVGVSLQAGANDNTFVGCKVEWNNGTNWQLFQSLNNNIIGGVTDRAGGSYGFDIRQSEVTIDGTILRRNGRDDASTSSHFLLGSNVMVSLNGIITNTGGNDGGGGNVTPNYIFDVVDADSGPLLVNGCDLTGYVTGLATGNTLLAAYSGCEGVLDNQRSIATASDNSVASGGGTLTCSASGNDVLPLSTFQASVRRYKAQISTRNSSTSAVALNDFMIAITRGGGGSAAGLIYNVSDSASTTINETGADVDITIANVAADGSSFDVIATNTSGSNLQIRMQAVPVN